MTWFGWLLVVWYTFSTLINMYVAGKVERPVTPGDWKKGILSHTSLIMTSVIGLVLIIMVLTVGTGTGIF